MGVAFHDGRHREAQPVLGFLEHLMNGFQLVFVQQTFIEQLGRKVPVMLSVTVADATGLDYATASTIVAKAIAATEGASR